MKFLWTDIETTGLNPRKDLILAVGIIITEGPEFREVARGEWVVPQDPEVMDALLSTFVREMHTKSGLLVDVETAWFDGWRPVYAETEIGAWLLRHLGPPAASAKDRPAWAGNSVHFDKAFISEQMPCISRHYSYRCLDVSTLKLLAMATIPGAKEWNDSRPEAEHTPLADLEGSLAELAHWREVLRGAP